MFARALSYLPFTASYKTELYKKAKEAEHKLLKATLPFYDGKVQDGFSSRSEQIEIEEDTFINTFVMEHADNKKHLVLSHGYGAGLGMHYRMYGQLKDPKYKLWSIDFQGMGLSSRKPLPAYIAMKEGQPYSDEDLDAVEHYFVDSLEKWRAKCQIEKMVLAGHSFGGYLSVAYAKKYPERVEKLLLISPAGMSPRPPNSFINNLTFGYRTALRTIQVVWDWNVTPQWMVRMGGSLFGERLVRNYVMNRFSTLVDAVIEKPPSTSKDSIFADSVAAEQDLEEPTETQTPANDSPATAMITKYEMELLISYIHALCSQEGSGEYALSRLLSPGGFARRPLTIAASFVKEEMPHFLTAAGEQPPPEVPQEAYEKSIIGEISLKHNIPVVFYFGQFDFMDKRHPLAMSKHLYKGSHVVVVPNCGHQLILQNPEFLGREMLSELQE